MWTSTLVGEKANTVELCNLYKICRCTWAGSFYPLHPVKSSPGTPITTGGEEWRHSSPAPGCRGLCTSTIYQGKFTSETLSSTCSTGIQIFKSSMWLQSFPETWVPQSFRHVAWCYWQLTPLFLLHYNFLFCCCEAFFFLFKPERRKEKKKGI